MKKLILILLAIALAFPTIAKKKDKKEEDEKGPYEFTMIKDIPTSAVKNQYRSGTCWAFAGIAFLETELIRTGKGEIDLSEMFVVRNAYSQKALNTVRWHGNLNFGMGGNFHDVLWVYQNHGMLNESDYTGLEYGEEKHVHGEMDALLKSYVETVMKNRNKKLTPVWHQGFNGILDAYLGEVPTDPNPISYSKDLGLNMDDYVEITSFTHHPFYEKFILEIPDNWMMAEYYNVPLEELMQITEEAIKAGYSVGWDADVSEKGFSRKLGLALVPDEEKPDIDGMESDKWGEMDEKERQKLLYSFNKIVTEKEISQEMRQQQFNNYKTTDDHLMLLTGIAKDQRGNTFFKVKNSWSEKSHPYNGFFFASKAFLELKTISILLHKDGLSEIMKQKLGID